MHVPPRHCPLALQIVHVTTGCGELDAILGGGIESGSITELYGEFRTGSLSSAERTTLACCACTPAAVLLSPSSLDVDPFDVATGKSQLCLTVAVSSFLPRELGGGEGRTMYLDTEGAFRPERLAHIAERFELDADFVTENVVYARIHNCDQLDQTLLDAAALFSDESGAPFRLLIVDSIIGV